MHKVYAVVSVVGKDKFNIDALACQRFAHVVASYA
jgi:hypothetical protein